MYYFVNPQIIDAQGEEEGEEGCLSVPEMAGTVKRPSKITIRGLDREGNPQELTFEGFHARVMCHENDHLDGILYTDKAERVYHPQPPEEGETE